MRRPNSSVFALCLCSAVLGMSAARGAQASKAVDSRFGFTGPEIFPIDPQISHLKAADLDGDGLPDLVVVNNSRSRINLLYNRTRRSGLPSKELSSRRRELNELPPDARFQIESIASEKRIAALEVADLNGDQRPDLAYYGEPKELVVQFNEGSNHWSSPKRFSIEDGLLNSDALTHGDLNGDGRTDLLLLGETCLYYLSQTADRELAEPMRIPYSGTVKAVHLLDANGDGKADLHLVNRESPTPLHLRLQLSSGQLGPEYYFTFPPVRAYAAEDLDGDGRTEIITIAQSSGRAQVSHFEEKPSEVLSAGFRAGQFHVLPLNRTAKARRGTAWADLNRDRLPDLVVTEPDSGQLTLYLQNPDGSLATGRTFSTLAGVTEVVAADWDNDGLPEVFLLSPEERQLGFTRLDAAGHMAFPSVVPLEGKPLIMAVGPLEASTKLVLASITDQDGRRTLVLRTADGRTRSQRLSDSFKANPASLIVHDVNQDGLVDLLVVIPYEKLKVLLQSAGKDFQELDVAPPGGISDQPWTSAADVDGDGRPELLLAQRNFVRAVILQQDPAVSGATQGEWAFRVKDQINGSTANSRIVGAAAIPAGTNTPPTLFLLDADRKALTACERDAVGVWQPRRNLPLPFSDFFEIGAVAIGGPRPNAIAFLGLNAVAWLALDGKRWELVERDGYETPIKDGRLTGVLAGDLNQDGRKDLVFLETARNHLDLVVYEPPGRLAPANRWQVFEERTFRSRRSDAPEPREALVVDGTGDGKNDLVVLVHDRILLYPQE